MLNHNFTILDMLGSSGSASVNHYHTKSRAEFAKKSARGRAFNAFDKLTPDHYDVYVDRCNLTDVRAAQFYDKYVLGLNISIDAYVVQEEKSTVAVPVVVGGEMKNNSRLENIFGE